MKKSYLSILVWVILGNRAIDYLSRETAKDQLLYSPTLPPPFFFWADAAVPSVVLRVLIEEPSILLRQ